MSNTNEINAIPSFAPGWDTSFDSATAKIVTLSHKTVRLAKRSWWFTPWPFYVSEADRLPGEVGKISNIRILEGEINAP